MNEIKKPLKRTFYKASFQDGKHEGITEPNLVTTTKHDLTQSSDADEVYNVLPTSGELIEGYIYSFEGGMVIVRQTHTRTNFRPEQTPALFTIFRKNSEGAEWIANENVLAGDERTYQGENYICIQSHTTVIGQQPPNVSALWNLKPIDAAGNIREWSSYQSFEFQNMPLGTKVIDEGDTYELINQGQGFRKPSGQFGYFGWQIV